MVQPDRKSWMGKIVGKKSCENNKIRKNKTVIPHDKLLLRTETNDFIIIIQLYIIHKQNMIKCRNRREDSTRDSY